MFLWTFFSVLQTWRNNLATVAQTSLLFRKTWNFKLFLSKTKLSMCSSGHIGFIFDIPVRFCPVNSKLFLVNFQKWWEISCPKIFFSESFFAWTRTLQFWKTCLFFTWKVQVSLLKVQAIKKTVFRSKFSTNFSSKHVHSCFDHLDSLFAKGQKKSLQLQNSYKKPNFSGKRIFFPQNIRLDPRVAVVRTLTKKFPNKARVFWLKVQRSLKQCAMFQAFSPQRLPRLCTLQFRQFWRNFPPE